jgi:hypothetical protein
VRDDISLPSGHLLRQGVILAAARRVRVIYRPDNPLPNSEMKYRTLPGTELNVSEVCLGTMTWGEQNSESEARAQLDYAVAQGINFIDTAEMYPVPPNPTTQGQTEAYLGTGWRGNRAPGW